MRKRDRLHKTICYLVNIILNYEVVQNQKFTVYEQSTIICVIQLSIQYDPSISTLFLVFQQRNRPRLFPAFCQFLVAR